MRPTIDHGVEPESPSVRFTTLGGYVVGSLVSVTDFQATDFATKQPLTWPDGKPQINKHMRLVLVRSHDVELSVNASQYDVVSVWLSGPRLYDYREAVRAHMREHDGKPLAVGTMVEVKFADEVPSKTKGFAPRKVLAFRFRAEAPGDKQAADRAEQAYIEDQPTVERPPVVQQPQSYEEPF